MSKIYVISRKGKLLDTIQREEFMGKDKHGFPEKHVKYKGKEYVIYDMSGTSLGRNASAIYPYGYAKYFYKELKGKR